MNSGSSFLAEIRRITSSFSPLGILSSSTVVTKPHYIPDWLGPVWSWCCSLCSPGIQGDGYHAPLTMGVAQMQRPDQIGQPNVLQCAAQCVADNLGVAAHRAGRFQLATSRRGIAFGEANRAFERVNNVRHGNGICRTGQAVS